MFIGHFALGFAAKRAVPRTSLATLFAAAQLADLAWPVLLAAGLEAVRIDPGNTAFTPLDFVSYPYSHSLALLLVWAVLFGAVYRAAAKRNGRTFVVLAGLVVSHWVLDFVTHRPDMPLYPGGPKVGLGLWNSRVGTVALEVAMFLAGTLIYARATRPRDAVGRYGFFALWALLIAAYAGNFGAPPPPSVGAIIVVSFAGAALILALGWWVDSHRVADV